MEKLREKINLKIETLKNEYYKYYENNDITESEQLIREQILKEIEILQWVIEESYKDI